MAKTKTAEKAPVKKIAKASAVKTLVEKTKALFEVEEQASHSLDVAHLSTAEKKELDKFLFSEGFDVIHENNGVNIHVEKIKE